MPTREPIVNAEGARRRAAEMFREVGEKLIAVANAIEDHPLTDAGRFVISRSMEDDINDAAERLSALLRWLAMRPTKGHEA